MNILYIITHSVSSIKAELGTIQIYLGTQNLAINLTLLQGHYFNTISQH